MLDFPDAPVNGDKFTAQPSGKEYQYNGVAWLLTGKASGGVGEAPIDGKPYERQDAAWTPATTTSTTISETAPTGAEVGDTWWVPSSGNFCIWYDDGTTSQWVEIAGTGGIIGATMHIGDGPPATPTPGAFWFRSDQGRLYIFYEDADGSQWVQVSGA